jgi:hypothetical protein
MNLRRTMFTKEFWSFSGERAIKTFAQAALAYLGTGSVGLLSIDYGTAFSIAGGAALLSILTSLVTHKS